ncbi:MAG TPA: tetratricopeptide repeat protein [Casimicrobiaceae bacterium]|nr:tetratricopeptide repeat protein [Casimicrobiaceae bacterium]
MTSLLAIVALLAAAPESGTISITTANPEAAAAYVEAYDQLFCGHGDRARAAASRALSLDPNLALAKALLYAITPGTDSMKQVDDAAAAGASLPEAERTELAAWAAAKHFDNEKARSLQMKLVELAPGDWRSHYYAGSIAFFVGHDVDKGKAQLLEATRLNPGATSPWMGLAAIAVEQGDRAGAADATKHVADMRPDDPAVQADYAYALLTAGKLDEAEATARKATTLPNADAKPLAALANVELYRGQYARAHQDLAKARALSKDDFERMGLIVFESLGYAAEGKYQGVLRSTAALEKEARAKKNPNFYVTAATQRAFAANLLGKFGEARKYANEALARCEKEPLSDAGRKGLQQGIRLAAIWAQSFGGKLDEAEKTLAILEKDAADTPNDQNVQSSAAWGRGMLKLARGDARGAAAEMAKCVPTFDGCHFHMALAQEKAGDAAGAHATRAALLAQQRSQDTFFLTLRSQLLKKGKPMASADQP